MTAIDRARTFAEIPLGLIDAPALASREAMDEEKLDELARDIRAKGVLQPLLLARVDDRYEVVAGHRRLLASTRAGLATVPALVYASKTAALEGAKYSENRYREELSPAEEAIWFAELLERDCGGDVDRLCAQLGERRGYVENRLLLFQGDPKVFDALRARQIAIGVAQQLNKCRDEPYRRYLLHQAIVGGATVAVVAGWLQDWQRSLGAAPSTAADPAPASAPGPIPEMNYFTCAVCGSTDHVHLMRPINVHDYCRLAVLDKLLEAHAHQAITVFPRTLDEARAFAERLLARFPELVDDGTPARG